MEKLNWNPRGGMATICSFARVAAMALVVEASVALPSFAATHITWAGATGDYTDPSMWVGGVAPGPGVCADLSRVSDENATAYIRDGMSITNGWINCAYSNDVTIAMSGGYVHLTQSEAVNDAALKLARGVDVSGGEPIRPNGTFLISGGKVVVTNGCVTVGERGNGVLTMTGGELWARGRLSIARLEGSSGTMTVSGGAKVTAFSFYLPRPSATLIIDGGTISRTRFDNSLPNAASFIWGDAGATVQIGANGAVLYLPRDAAATIPISSLPGTAGTLEKRGAGALRFADTATNTYAGATIISEGAIMAESPHNLPGYDEPGRVTVKSGASLIFGKGWSTAEKATAMANVTVEAGGAVKAAFDVSDEDVTISDDLSYTGGMEKYGAKMLTLTGHNTFGGEQKIWEGTLRADFGTGLDSNYCVTLCGGSLSSVSGNLVATIGSGAGQVNIVSGSTPAFTARGVPFTINLLNGTGSSSANDNINAISVFPNRTLILNDANADQPITFQNNIDILGTTDNDFFKIYVNSGVATMAGSIMDSNYNKSRHTTFKKYGAGTLRMANAGFRDRCYRFNIEEGDVVFDHPASVANAANGSGYFYYINKNGTGTLYATNQTVQTENNCNCNSGTMLFKGGKLKVGGNINANGGTVVLDGGTVNVSASVYGANAADVNGYVVLTNGARMTVTTAFSTAGETATGTAYGRLEVNDGCIVTTKCVNVSSGEVVQRGGTVRGTDTDSIRIGRYANREGFYYLSGGRLESAQHFHMGYVSGGLGQLWQTGGTVGLASTFSIGYAANSTGTVHVAGGVIEQSTGTTRVGENGVGTLVVRDAGVVKTGVALSMADSSSTGNGRTMLCKGGVIEAAKVLGHGTTENGRYAEFVFDGGTLRATADSTTYVSNLTEFAVGTGGGAVDTDGHDVTFAQPLTSTARDSDLAHRWSFNGDFVDSVTGETAIDNKGGTFISGKDDLGQAVQLAGGNKGTSYISLGPKKLPVDGSECTIEFWARVDKHNGWQRAFDIGKDGNAFFTLTFRKAANTANSDYCGIKYNGVQTGVSDVLVTYDVGKRPWGHICVVCKRGDDGRWKIRGYRKYRDGEDIIKRFEYDAPPGWSLAKQDQTYTYIGRSLQNDLDTSATFDELRIWKRALTDEEIEANGELGPDALPAAAFEKRGMGTLTLTGANTYAQPTVVTGGTLALAAGASLPAETAVTVGAGATLDLGGNAATAASLSGAGTLANGVLTLSGTADISSMSFSLADGVLPTSFAPVVVLEAVGGVTGQFASISLPRGHRLTYSGNQVRLAKGGMMIIIR